MSQRVLIVIPCYNEAKRLQVEAFRRFIESSSVEIVFVDDGSRDNTREVLESLKASNPGRITIVATPANHGKAEAVRYGIGIALKENPEFIGYWDADLATPLEVIVDFVKILREKPGIDMIFGARVKLLGRSIERKAVRHYLGRTFATVVSVVLQLPIYDTQCGAKIFRVSDRTRTIFRDRFISRWVFDVELIARYIQCVGSSEAAGARIYEYPLQTWVDINGSKVRPKDFFIAFWDVGRIYRKYLMR